MSKSESGLNEATVSPHAGNSEDSAMEVAPQSSASDGEAPGPDGEDEPEAPSGSNPPDSRKASAVSSLLLT